MQALAFQYPFKDCVAFASIGDHVTVAGELSRLGSYLNQESPDAFQELFSVAIKNTPFGGLASPMLSLVFVELCSFARLTLPNSLIVASCFVRSISHGAKHSVVYNSIRGLWKLLPESGVADFVNCLITENIGEGEIQFWALCLPLFAPRLASIKDAARLENVMCLALAHEELYSEAIKIWGDRPPLPSFAKMHHDIKISGWTPRRTLSMSQNTRFGSFFCRACIFFVFRQEPRSHSCSTLQYL